MQHLITAKNITPEKLQQLLDVATDMKTMVLARGGDKRFKNYILGLIFFEPSTRTLSSFQAAMQKLGGSVIIVNEAYSSVQKGETLEDTIRTMCCYCDALVLRHPIKGSSEKCAAISTKPLINAGDGIGEHPTQALIDMFTIVDEIRKFGNSYGAITIVFVGDLKHSRTIHSLIDILSLYNDATLVYVHPEGLELPPDIFWNISEKGHKQVIGLTLEEAIKIADVLYVTRIQKERFENIEDYNRVVGSYVVDAELMKLAKLNMIVMHPLPRTGEIAVDVDSDPRAAYFRQMENGVYMRMAIIDMMMKPSAPMVKHHEKTW